ncbi:NUDIX family hydrolase [Ceratobasidium sp. AG-Ba]|nr:NUDIX family hydrolase [Ceratobasidium sp. AG-Ba]
MTHRQTMCMLAFLSRSLDYQTRSREGRAVPQDAKWVTLEKLTWKDQDGKERAWESASRKTRGKSGVDAVAILAILKSKSASFRPTVIIEQYRPPVGAYVIDAIRELEEETGYKASGVAQVSPLLVSDPGMTSANMKLVAVNVDLNEAKNPQKLDEGEHIVKRVIELDKLLGELSGSDRRISWRWR